MAMLVGRMRGESKLAWAAFRIYLTIPPEERVFEEVLYRLGQLARRPNLVASWVERFAWNDRAIAHARQVEEAERSERIRRLERQADEFRLGLLAPYTRAEARYEALIEAGEPQDSLAIIWALGEMMAAIPLVEQALLLTGNPEHAEAAIQGRADREAIVRSMMMSSFAGKAAEADAGAN